MVAFKISSMVNANQSEQFWRALWADRTKTIQTDLSGQRKTDKCISTVFKWSWIQVFDEWNEQQIQGAFVLSFKENKDLSHFKRDYWMEEEIAAVQEDEH